MTPAEIAELVSRGRTDLVFDLLASEEGRERVQDVLTWFIYYNDVTALRAVMHAGLGISGLDLDRELGHAAFFGHWKAADFLLAHGANVGWTEPETGETPLHSALCKAGRPHYGHVVRLLLDAGADPNARTIPGKETGAFMRPSCGMCARAEKRRCIAPPRMRMRRSSSCCLNAGPTARSPMRMATRRFRGPACTCGLARSSRFSPSRPT